MYVRNQGTHTSRKTGKPSGIIAVARHMKQNGWLSPPEIEEIQQIENWFENNLPDPPLYSETDSPKAITWFRRETTIKMLEKIERIERIIEKNGWKIEVVSRENDPSAIIYEDEYQIAAI